MVYLSILLMVSGLCSNGATGEFQDSNVNRLIELLQKSLKNPKHQISEDTKDYSSNKIENNSNFGSLKSREIISLIEQASKDHEKSKKYHASAHSNRHSSSKNNRKLLNELFSNVHGDKTVIQKSSKQRLIPNKLFVASSEIENEVKHEAVGNLDDYSKIYIVLNPRAFQKSKNNKAINDLLTKILSLSTQRDRPKKKPTKVGRYKGFPVKKYKSLRRARDSREMFIPKESDEDYKKKRNRNDHGGGGGGRTAIPYIRHRGDIYERDN